MTGGHGQHVRMTVTDTRPDLAERLTLLLAELGPRYGVPGATLAVLTPDGVVEAAHGVINKRTGVEATPDAVHQIGSISKVWTATLVMQLVDEGLVDLDAPVTTYLPGFRISEESVSRQVTVRHLLTHTSGIDGDLFLDTGRGDDAVARYVEAMAELSPVHPIGAAMSYCNSGYTLLGHLVATLRGGTWEQVVRERLFAPLGLQRAGTLPEEALLHRAFVGHALPPGTDPAALGEAWADAQVPVPVWGISRSAGPAGLIHATSAEVLAFARLHLSGGLAPDGTRLLSEESVRAMQVPQVPVPDRWTLGTHWGLGWFLDTWDGHPVYGHDGATLGQNSFLRVLPDSGVAISLGANGGRMRELFEALLARLVPELAGHEVRELLQASGQALPADAEQWAGTYSRLGVAFDVELVEEGLRVVMRTTATPPGGGELPPPVELMLRHAVGDAYVTRLPGATVDVPVVFFRVGSGTAYLHLGARSTPRSGGATR